MGLVQAGYSGESQGSPAPPWGAVQRPEIALQYNELAHTGRSGSPHGLSTFPVASTHTPFRSQHARGAAHSSEGTPV